MPKINQEEYEILKEIRRNGYEEIRRNSMGDIAVRVVGEKVTSHQYLTEHNDKFKFLEATGDYWSIAELIEEYESEETEVKKDKRWFVDKWTKERNKTDIHDPMYHFINEFIADVNQLDEPETLSQGHNQQAYRDGFKEGERQTAEYFESITEEPSQEQVQKYLSEHGIEVVEKEPETVASVMTDFYESLERLREVLAIEVEEMEE